MSTAFFWLLFDNVPHNDKIAIKRSPQKEPKVAKPSNEIYSLECKQIDFGYGGPIFYFWIFSI